MKLSVSLPESDVVLLDEYARATGLSSRSAAVRHAIQLLRHPSLEADYAAAWREWDESPDQTFWEGAVDDGLS